MNEDRIEGAGRELLGEGERAAGTAVGSERLEGQGLVDQMTGAVQHGYGKAKDAVDRVMADAPGALGQAAESGRELTRRGDQAVRERLGDNGPGLVVIGVVALLGLSVFALVRSRAAAPAPKPVRRKPRTVRRA